MNPETIDLKLLRRRMPKHLRLEIDAATNAEAWLLRAAVRYAKEQQRSRARIDCRTYKDRVKRRQKVADNGLEVRR